MQCAMWHDAMGEQGLAGLVATGEAFDRRAGAAGLAYGYLSNHLCVHMCLFAATFAANLRLPC